MAEAAPEAFRRPAFLQLLAAGGMELCRLYALVDLLFRLNGLPPFPLRWAVLLFVTAVMPGIVARGRGWRVYLVGLLHLAALLPAAVIVARAFGRWAGADRAPAGLRWIAAAAAASGFGDWIALVAVLAGGLAFWWSGIGFNRRSPSGDVLTRRFDLGIGVLAAVVFIGWVTRQAGPALPLLIPSYFLFAVLAISLARGNGTGSRSYPIGLRGVGVSFSFGLAAVILGLATLPLLPLLQDAARAGYAALRIAAVSAWPVLLSIIHFLLRLLTRTQPDQTVPPDKARDIPPSGRSLPELGLLGIILKWIMIGVLGAVVLFIIGCLVWQIVLFLGSRTPGGRGKEDRLSPALLLRRLIAGLAALLAALAGVLRRGVLRQPDAVEAFARLCRWGGRSGARRGTGETPLEYGRRLDRLFPELAAPIDTIVETFNRQFYGVLPPDPGTLRDLGRHCRALGGLRHWRARIGRRLRPLSG